MLEPISLGQGRTHCPGLAADERGVVMGQKLALFFADIARAVGFFRSYSRDVSLDDILPNLEIQEAVSERGGREIMVRFDVSGSYTADRAAQAARMHRGRAATGSALHFVPYRDRRSPLGYDVSNAEDVATDAAEGLVLYGEAGADRRVFGRTIALRDLILNLSARPLTQAERESERYEALVVRAEKGLSREVSRYLWQRQVRSTVKTAVTAKKSLFSDEPREVQLIRCEDLPRHIAQLLHQTPGLRVFVPVQPHLLVEWGHRHPIALESCGAAFTEDETILFAAPPAKVERLLVEEDEVDIRDLVDVTLHGPGGVIDPPQAIETTRIEALDVELKLARLPRSGAATQALLIPTHRLSWFIKLVYVLPAAILRAYEACIAEPYIIVINRRGVHGIPFGAPMTELYPQIFSPVGMQLLPRVDYDLLREHLQIRPEQSLYFFPEDGQPFSVPIDALKPLSRAVVAQDRAQESIVELSARELLEEAGDTNVMHSRQSVFSLWRGTRIEQPAAVPELGPAVKPRRALPGPPATSTPDAAASDDVPRLPPPRPKAASEASDDDSEGGPLPPPPSVAG